MVNSSFFADGGVYDTADVVSNDTTGGIAPSQAPSSFYPDGAAYAVLANADDVIAAIAGDVEAAELAATSAAASASTASTAATSASGSATAASTSATSAAAAAASTVAANILINSDFRINQMAYVSGAALSAGAYGHDQWKAGASGGDYSFTQLASSTQITIASGKSLIQPIEDVNVVGGSYVLSWTGTAQARAGVNTLTPSGSYASSPLLITGQTAGTVMSVEFNAGTLGKVKLEKGTAATPYTMASYQQELLACMRYLEPLAKSSQGFAYNTTNALLAISFRAPKRAAPSLIAPAGSIVVTHGTTSGYGIWTATATPTIGTVDTTGCELFLTFPATFPLVPPGPVVVSTHPGLKFSARL